MVSIAYYFLIAIDLFGRDRKGQAVAVRGTLLPSFTRASVNQRVKFVNRKS